MRGDIKIRIGGDYKKRPGRVWSYISLLALGLVLVATVLAASASAQTTRLEQASFGGSPGALLTAIAVDQSTGDVYVADHDQHIVRRFDAGGAPDNFTAGPGAGTNSLTGFQASGNGPSGITVDNSGGPMDGDFYVIDGDVEGTVNTSVIKVYARSGALLGEITEAGAEPQGPELEEEPNLPSNRLYSPCGVAVDQSNGSLYVAEPKGFNGAEGHIWRYSPSSPSGTINRSDYVLTGVTTPEPCKLAANAGHVYTIQEGSVREYEASAFTVAYPKVEGTEVASNAFGVGVDPGNGDIYVDEAFRVAVYDQAGKPLYRFGEPREIGVNSIGTAVKDAPPSAAAKAYVNGEEGEVHAYGPVTQIQHHTLPELSAFGPDGTSASVFGVEISPLALHQITRSLYVASDIPSGIFGFDVSSPPSFALLNGFDPLSTLEPTGNSGLAVDNSGNASDGDVYLALKSTGLVYGFDASGNQLGGNFPIDPEASPGAPDGSPKEICGVAVDSAGHIWVANKATKRILEYGADGASLGVAIDASAAGSPCHLAFDAEGNLYVGNDESLWRFSSASGYTVSAQIVKGDKQGDLLEVAVDRAAGHVFAVQKGVLPGGLEAASWVDEYDESGNFLDEYLSEAHTKLLGVAVEETSHDLYIADNERKQVRVFGPPAILPEVSAAPASAIGNNSTTLNGTIITQQVALTDCHFDYVSEEAFRVSGFSNLSSGGSVSCTQSPGSIPTDFEAHPVSANVSGLADYTGYRFRLAAANAQGSLASSVEGFTTASPPGVEIAGAPDHSATTATLNGRVNPRNGTTTFHFEYGDQGRCAENPCLNTADHSAGSGNEIELVASQIEGLKPNATYHYRLVADNGNPSGKSLSAETTVTTLESDEPLSHGHFPGPPDSDRGYEQVSLPESGGNPVGTALGFSEDGNRALYSIEGGTPTSYNGTLSDYLFAERTAEGWRSRQVTPPRSPLIHPAWSLTATSGLTTILGANDTNNETTDLSIWRLSPFAEPLELFEAVPPQARRETAIMGISANGRREIVELAKGAADPTYPDLAAAGSLYDVSSGMSHLVSLLPGNVPACVNGNNMPSQATANWISADGSRVYFPSESTAASCGGPTELYMRDVEAGQSTLLSGPVISGADCGATLIRATEDAVFFWSQSRLTPNDTAPATCGGSLQDGDVYRYDLGNRSLKCLTCVVPGIDANVSVGAANASQVPTDVGVAPDGSRIYFKTKTHLLPGAQPEGEFGAYVVEVESGALSYVAPLGNGESHVGQTGGEGNALSADGSVLVFRSNSSKLSPIGGVGGNGGQYQYYRYDDRDRSLVCISCTPSGRSLESVPSALTQLDDAGLSLTAASQDGSTIAFVTANPLLGGDQNTPGPGANPVSGQDVYEWRNGQLLLITDGLTQWPVDVTNPEGPKLSGISRSGRDVYFSVPAQYTPDALDGYRRLYDARIGGGIEFPQPPQPCSLEVCQGTPKGAPLEQAPGTVTFSGPGNVTVAPPSNVKSSQTLKCKKAQRRVLKGKKLVCVPTKHKKQQKKRKKAKTKRSSSRSHKSNRNRRSAR